MRDAPGATPDSKASPRGCLSLFFLVFLFAGLLAFLALTRHVLESLRVWTWETASCQVESSTVAMTENVRERPFRATVGLRYEWGGQAYTSSHDSGFRDYRKASRYTQRFVPGLSVECFVDPGSPRDMALARGAPWIALFLLLPLVVVAVGGGGLYGIWFHRPGVRAKPLSHRRRGTQYVALGAGALFAIVGGGLYWALCHQTVRDWIGSQGWLQTECLVEASRLSEEDTEDGTGYRADFLYRYRHQGKEYRASRARFRLMSGNRSGERALLKRYPVGQTAVCLVDPGDPTRAVLERGFDKSLFLALIPVAFFGFGVLLLAGRGRTTPPPTGAPTTDGPAVLRPQTGPVGRLAGCGCFTLIFNGVLTIFIWEVAEAWMRGRGNWFETFFLTPFVLAGLAGVGGVIYFALALLNPRLEIRVSRGRARPGDTVLVEWQLSGRHERVQRLDITFTGREEATYMRGTDTTRETEVFLRIPVVEAGRAGRGAFHLTIPSPAMHSFDAPHNKIQWVFDAKGEIRWWPDIKEEYPYTILPGGRGDW
ncbi:MAG: DUF3592 domain-containing protein [Bryobacterales bacterium]|nr:DUF3592 domain-containing protein [Bryobacterales bacterium]